MSSTTCEFEIPTRDRRTSLKGQIDLPIGKELSRYPAVLIVNGGWFMERDGFMGGSGTERDLVYRDLASDLVSSGVAVVRYDNRGVHCNEMTMPTCLDGSSELEITKHYLQSCIDADVRMSVTVQTQLNDVEDLWNYCLNHPRIDAKRTLIWAHSEGCLNVARLIGGGRICPRGVIFVCTATESPAGLVRWQSVDRLVDHVMRWDDDGDGRVSDSDVERQYPHDQLLPAVAITREMLKPPNDAWTRATIQDFFERYYEELKSAALSKPDDAPYPDAVPAFRMVAASNNWSKQWFEDTTPMIDHLAGYEHYASFHIGGIDSQSPGTREFEFAEHRIKSGAFVRPPRLVFHENRGHSLRTNEPAMGPMDHEAKESLVQEILEALAEA